MEKTKLLTCKRLAVQIRIETLKALAAAGCGHVGGALDLAELLAVLYNGRLRVRTEDPAWPDRDYFILSKGHAGPALYAALALRGFFPVEELATLNRLGTRLPSHCDRLKTRGIDMTAGSLGQGIGAAAGIALGNQLAGRENLTVCVVGDGEMQEGSVWEILLLAPQLRLKNFVVFVDNNGLQIDGPTKSIADLGDLSEKTRAFGWTTLDVDGHDVEAIDEALDKCGKADGPVFVNLHTVKGKGWRKYENQVGSHWVAAVTEEEIAEPLACLREEMRLLEAAM